MEVSRSNSFESSASTVRSETEPLKAEEAAARFNLKELLAVLLRIHIPRINYHGEADTRRMANFYSHQMGEALYIASHGFRSKVGPSLGFRPDIKSMHPRCPPSPSDLVAFTRRFCFDIGLLLIYLMGTILLLAMFAPPGVSASTTSLPTAGEARALDGLTTISFREVQAMGKLGLQTWPQHRRLQEEHQLFEGLEADCPTGSMTMYENTTLNVCKLHCMGETQCAGFTHSIAGLCITRYEVCDVPAGNCTGSWCFWRRIGFSVAKTNATIGSTTLGVQAQGDIYAHVTGVGGWGGVCTCPNGKQYQVGVRNNSCRSMACVNGISGMCEEVYRASREGLQVTCAEVVLLQNNYVTTTTTTTTSTSSSTTELILEQLAWKNKTEHIAGRSAASSRNTSNTSEPWAQVDYTGDAGLASNASKRNRSDGTGLIPNESNKNSSRPPNKSAADVQETVTFNGSVSFITNESNKNSSQPPNKSAADVVGIVTFNGSLSFSAVGSFEQVRVAVLQTISTLFQVNTTSASVTIQCDTANGTNETGAASSGTSLKLRQLSSSASTNSSKTAVNLSNFTAQFIVAVPQSHASNLAVNTLNSSFAAMAGEVLSTALVDTGACKQHVELSSWLISIPQEPWLYNLNSSNVSQAPRDVMLQSHLGDKLGAGGKLFVEGNGSDIKHGGLSANDTHSGFPNGCNKSTYWARPSNTLRPHQVAPCPAREDELQAQRDAKAYGAPFVGGGGFKPQELHQPALEETMVATTVIEGLDFDKLTTNTPLLATFKQQLVHQFATSNGVGDSQVSLILSKGSVRAEAHIQAKPGQSLPVKVPPGADLTDTIQEIAGIDSAKVPDQEIKAGQPDAYMIKKGTSTPVKVLAQGVHPSTTTPNAVDAAVGAFRDPLEAQSKKLESSTQSSLIRWWVSAGGTFCAMLFALKGGFELVSLTQEAVRGAQKAYPELLNHLYTDVVIADAGEKPLLDRVARKLQEEPRYPGVDKLLQRGGNLQKLMSCTISEAELEVDLCNSVPPYRLVLGSFFLIGLALHVRWNLQVLVEHLQRGRTADEEVPDQEYYGFQVYLNMLLCIFWRCFGLWPIRRCAANTALNWCEARANDWMLRSVLDRLPRSELKALASVLEPLD